MSNRSSYSPNFLSQCTVLPLLFLLLVTGPSCQNNKSVNSVFPESNPSIGPNCSENKIPGYYLIKKEDESLVTVNAPDDDSFINDWIKPNLNEIRWAESMKKIVVPTTSGFNDLVTEMVATSQAPQPNWGQIKTETYWAHEHNFRGQGVVIAVIDSTPDITHLALAPKIAVNQNELMGEPQQDDDQNGLIDDLYGWDFSENKPITNLSFFDNHGTHVSGIIVGSHQNWSGVAPEAKFIPISFLNPQGFGNILGAALAVRYATSRKVHIINASWGGVSCSPILAEEIQKATNQGILFVTASGNEGVNLDQLPFYPASFQFPLQITVAATRPSDYLAGYSNSSFELVHLAAPGEFIWSTLKSNHFGYMSGTSMAAPFVSGALAILKSAAPNASPALLRQAIFQGVEVKDYRVKTRGRLNIRKSLEWLLNQNPN
ncbi:MAG: S8 family peptidase [Pseudobdellovibrionaceae bacterium]|nr:S8 family peptidase [Pseudobdellovibrionaceae bacterium]